MDLLGSLFSNLISFSGNNLFASIKQYIIFILLFIITALSFYSISVYYRLELSENKIAKLEIDRKLQCDLIQLGDKTKKNIKNKIEKYLEDLILNKEIIKDINKTKKNIGIKKDHIKQKEELKAENFKLEKLIQTKEEEIQEQKRIILDYENSRQELQKEVIKYRNSILKEIDKLYD